ncbi:MAG: PilZ domain-containing protein [Treponema sp.]|nr:PilZ domain-containing protein [Treponema sp.]
MHIFIPILIIIVCVITFIRIAVINSEKINFYAVGFDSGFRFSEIGVLWRLAKINEVETPLSMFFSLPSLNRCISNVIVESKKAGTYETGRIQIFLQKLYDYRTRVALDVKKRMGIESTKSLSKGQKLRIILKGNGVFSSKILNNEREIAVSLPLQYSVELKKNVALSPSIWEHKEVSVYLWRKDDAAYVFDTVVYGSGTYTGIPCLFLRHSDTLERMQKRKSIRVKCEIYADMYFIRSTIKDYDAVEQTPGFNVLLEDISEDGALIRIGGRGKSGEKIKLQFSIGDDFIMMYGVIRSVEYNSVLNQSRLHFECTHINGAMRNSILTFVYKIIPQNEREINQAMDFIDEDSRNNDLEIKDDSDKNNEGAQDEDAAELEMLEPLEPLESDEKSEKDEELEELEELEEINE